MIRSLAVIMVPVVLMYWLLSRDIGDHPVERIDYAPVLAEAKEKAPYTVMAPEGLGPEWIPNRSQYVSVGETTTNGSAAPGNQWQLGFISPDEIYYSILQTDAERIATVGDLSRGGSEQGTEMVNGQEWERWRSADGRTGVLAYTDPEGVTISVTADTDFAALATFAATLEPQN